MPVYLNKYTVASQSQTQKEIHGYWYMFSVHNVFNSFLLDDVQYRFAFESWFSFPGSDFKGINLCQYDQIMFQIMFPSSSDLSHYLALERKNVFV